MSAHTSNARALAARYSLAETWSRRRWKRLLIWSWAERNRCAWRADLKRFICRSRRRVGWCEFSALLFRPLCRRCSTPGISSRFAAGQLASLSRIRLQSKWRHRDDVTDDHLVVHEDHPVDDQPQDLLPDLERRIDERVANAGTERLEPLQQPDPPPPLRAVAADLVEPLPQMPAMVLDLPPTLLQLLQLDRAGLIGVDQPPDLAVQHLELALDARALALVGAVDGGIAAALLEARPQEGRIGQQPADPTPDLLLERAGRGASAITGARGVARVAGRADVTVPAAVRGADHAPATPAADQQRAQQISVPGVVPCGAFAVAGQLLLGQAPKRGIDDGGRRHRIHSSTGRKVWLPRSPGRRSLKPVSPRGVTGSAARRR